MKMMPKSPIIITIIILFKTALVLAQQIITNTKDVFIKPNTNVLMECKIIDYDPNQDLIEWCKNDFCTWGRLFEVTSQQRLQYKSLPKYFITGNRTYGEWNLLIENVTESEVGDYKCSLTRRSTKLKIESKPTKLMLMKKPHSIMLEEKKPIEIELDQVKTITCKVLDGMPRPTITWKLNDPKSGQETLLNNSVNDNDEEISTSRLTLRGTLNLRGKQLTCLVDHPLLNKSFSSWVNINLKFAPILSFNIDSELAENQTQKFECSYIAEPGVSTPSVISLIDKKGQVVTQSVSGSIQLKLTREMNGQTISCFNENSIGKSLINHVLNITYPPQFKESLEPILIITNSRDTIKLSCKVDSNPPAQVVWFRNDNEIVGHGDSYEIKNIKSEFTTKMFYQIGCRCSTGSKYKEINSKTFLITNGIPLITGETIYFAENQRNFLAKFNVLSSPELEYDPKCTKLTISKNENLKQSFLPIENFGRYELIRETNDQNVITNISRNYFFKINGISSFDIGIFNCSATNSFGTSSFIFEIQMKNDNSKFIIALSTSILFLILLLCLIVLIVVFFLKLRMQRNKLKKENTITVKNGFSNTSYLKNSPNLSVSEWVANSERLNEDKTSQCDIAFEEKLSTNENICNTLANKSKTSISSDDQNLMDKKNLNYECLMVPLDPSNYILNSDADPNSSLNYNYYTINNKPNANILSSKLQTNV